MTPDEIQAMARGIAEASGGSRQWIGYLLAAVLGGAVSYFGSYFAEKGKGRATKEDVELLTKKVEEVKVEYQKQVEDLKARHQLRMIAAERRLEAHQQAFQHLRKLQNSLGGAMFNNLPHLAYECQAWFDANGLFLSVDARAAFSDAFISANLLHSETGDSEDSTRSRGVYRKAVLEAVTIVLRDVELPSWSDPSEGASPA